MRIPRCLTVLSLFLAVGAAAQAKHKSEAQTDGFMGPVRSVSTHVEMARVRWQQPGGPSLIIPIFCRDCEYSPDGFRTRSGQTTEDGKFLGDTIELTRDGLGHVMGRKVVNASDGTVSLEEQLGPYGAVDRVFYVNGQPEHVTLTSDPLGHLAELSTFDSHGNQTERDITRTDTKGQWTERAVWKNGQMTYRETYDPDTDFQRFESFDASGAVKVTFTFAHGRVLTYWSATDEPNQFGSSFSDNKGNGDFNRFQCHKNGDCVMNRVHYTYTDASKRNPSAVEWYSPQGSLLYAAYYAYEFDDQQNWTKRTIWVRSPDLPERTLYETDIRTVTYWDR